MAFMNTKKSALFVKSGSALPATPDNFFEQTAEFIVNPNPTITEFKRISAKLGTTDSYTDACHSTFTLTANHQMLTSNKAGDALMTPPLYGEVLKVCGFNEVIDISTEDEETVTYINSQTPTVGSAIANIDGKQFNVENSLVGDASFTFEIGKPAILDASFSGFLDNNGIPTDTALPDVELADEDLVFVTCTDIFMADGSTVVADKITISMNPEIEEYYALGLKEFSINDYAIKITASFLVDSADYADAMTKLIGGTVETIDIKLNTNDAGELVNGKSLNILAGLAKASASTDSIDKSRLKRDFTWLVQGNSAGENLKIIHGFFA